MLTCEACEKEIRGKGAFMPDSDGDFVCLSCFRKQAGFVPVPTAILEREEVETFVLSPNYSPGKKPRPKPTVRYKVSVVRPGGQVSKKQSKLIAITLHNLPPGNYSHSTKRP